MNSYERVMGTIKGLKTDRIPVIPLVREWCIFQTGYNILDMMSSIEKYAFSQFYCQKIFGYDAVFDLLGIHAESEAMGCKIKYSKDVSPSVIEPAVKDYATDLAKLKIPDPHQDGNLPLILSGIRLLKKLINGEVPLIAYIQGPFRHASMLRGAEVILKDIYKNKAQLEELMDIATESLITYGKALVEAEADIIFIADPTSSGDAVSRKQWEKWGLPYTKRLVSSLKKTNKDVKVILHICGNTADRLDTFFEIDLDIISLDEKVDLSLAKKIVGEKVCLLGNVSPGTTLFMGTPEEVLLESRQCIEKAGKNGRFILSSGCLIPGNVSAENMSAMISAVHNT